MSNLAREMWRRLRCRSDERWSRLGEEVLWNVPVRSGIGRRSEVDEEEDKGVEIEMYDAIYLHCYPSLYLRRGWEETEE